MRTYLSSRHVPLPIFIGAGDGTRTRDTLLGRQELYH